MRQALGDRYDPAMFDNPGGALRAAGPADQPAPAREPRRAPSTSGSATPSCGSSSAPCPAFQEDGKFSPTSTSEVLAGQGMTPLMFEERVRGELALSPLQDPMVGASFVARDIGAQLPGPRSSRSARSRSRRSTPHRSRRTSRSTMPTVKAYYDKNPAAFQTPEVAKIEYLTLSPGFAGCADEGRSPPRSRQHYEANAKQYTTAEERQASHILIAVKPDASAADKAAAKKPRRRYSREGARQSGAFAELAKEYSQDPGSAPAGRRPGIVRARLDGEAVRGRRVRGEGRRHHRAGPDRFRLSRHQGDRHHARARAVVRRGQGRRSRPSCGARRRCRNLRPPPSSSRIWSTSRPIRLQVPPRRSTSRSRPRR